MGVPLVSYGLVGGGCGNHVFGSQKLNTGGGGGGGGIDGNGKGKDGGFGGNGKEGKGGS